MDNNSPHTSAVGIKSRPAINRLGQTLGPHVHCIFFVNNSPQYLSGWLDTQWAWSNPSENVHFQAFLPAPGIIACGAREVPMD